MIKKSLVKITPSNTSLLPNAMIGKTTTIFKKLDPSTFPITIRDLSCLIAATVAASSGRLVPTAMMLSPIITSDNPKLIAIDSAPVTVSSEPTISTKRLKIVKKITFINPESSLFISISASLDLNKFSTNKIIRQIHKIPSPMLSLKSKRQ